MRAWSTVRAAFVAITMLAAGLFPAGGARADDPDPTGSLLDPGQLVVTGFSGTVVSDTAEADPASATKVDGTFIDPDGAAMRILDVGGIPQGAGDTDKRAAEVFSLTAREIGQVYGVAIDEYENPATGKPAPNIYLGATSSYGLHIVVPDRDGTGWPKRIVTGDPEAQWMEGQFGAGLGGDPGSLWKIDGVTGKPSVFFKAELNGKPNSGPGIGNVSYDKELKQLFVSDLETGTIFRVDLDGKLIGTFDHGVDGRAAEGLDPVADDSEDHADITSDTYRADDPSTWGFTQPPRRVWGLGTHQGRLYYAVAEGPEIWSVDIGGETGEFGAARREVALPADAEAYEIADIKFTTTGLMVLAQRPPVTGGYDYATPVASGPARVLRYRPIDGSSAESAYWEPVPEEYAVGLKNEYRNTAGGIAFGYAHKPEGGLDYARCEATLWTTGDSLFQQKTRAIKVEAKPGEADGGIDGLQGTAIDLVRPDNLPPENARFVDYDGRYTDYGYRGHLGDVEIPEQCDPAKPVWEPEYQAAWWDASYNGSSPPPKQKLDLSVQKYAVGICTKGGICRFEVKISNRGNTVYYGPLVINDTLAGKSVNLVAAGPSPWVCGQSEASVGCNRPPVFLKPGRSVSVWISVRLTKGWTKPVLGNCAAIGWLAGKPSIELIQTVAIELGRRGYYSGLAIQTLSPELASAISDYQNALNLETTGEIDRALLISLFGRGIYLDHDANPANDQACAEHKILNSANAAAPLIVDVGEKLYIPKKFKPQTTYCKSGFNYKNGSCQPICAPGTTWKNDHCVYIVKPLTCRWGKIESGGRCVCPSGTTEQPGARHSTCERSPRLRCYGGDILDGTCVCPEGSARHPIGKSSYICQKDTRIECSGGKLKGDRCSCPLDTYLVKFSDRSFACVQRQKDPTCLDGSLENGKCYCRDGAEPRQAGSNVYQCPSNEQVVVCINGYLDDNGRCQCKGDWDRQKQSRYIYRCVPPSQPVDIFTCIGGRTGDGVCYCRDGYAARRVTDLTFVCEAIQVERPVVCHGGDVVNGACYCPDGTNRQKYGFQKYKCVPSETGGDTPIQCKGGKVSGGACVCGKGDRPEQIDSFRFRCVPDQPSNPSPLKCINGYENDGQCDCRKGDKLQQLGEFTFRCNPPAQGGGDGCPAGTIAKKIGLVRLCIPDVGGRNPQISCDGGKVAGGQCICPAGASVVKLGGNRYACRPKDVINGGDTPPVIVCPAGREPKVFSGRTICVLVKAVSCPPGQLRIKGVCLDPPVLKKKKLILPGEILIDPAAKLKLLLQQQQDLKLKADQLKGAQLKADKQKALLDQQRAAQQKGVLDQQLKQKLLLQQQLKLKVDQAKAAQQKGLIDQLAKQKLILQQQQQLKLKAVPLKVVPLKVVPLKVVPQKADDGAACPAGQLKFKNRCLPAAIVKKLQALPQ